MVRPAVRSWRSAPGPAGAKVERSRTSGCGSIALMRVMCVAMLASSMVNVGADERGVAVQFLKRAWKAALTDRSYWMVVCVRA